MEKTSEIFKAILKDNISKARQVGEMKVGKDGTPRYWTEIKPGTFDWRKTKPQSSSTKDDGDDTTKDSLTSAQKLAKHLKASDDATLTRYASKPGNDPALRKLAYKELEERGVDVSGIDLNTGKIKRMKEAFGTDDDDDSNTSITDEDDDSDSIDINDEEFDFQNPDHIKEKFGKLKTKKQRIAADAFVHANKIRQADYLPPQKVIHSLNKSYASFLQSGLPLMIASGGAGVGKTHNLHLVAEYLGLKPFQPEVDEPGDGDYDYVEAPEVGSDLQLIQVLQEHNNKVIVFDDSDNILSEPKALGILKKATAGSGKRIIGRKSSGKDNIDPFEFTGQIIFLTNKDQHDLTKNEHMKAIYSRAQKQNINFTKKEQLEMIEKLRHKMNFTGLPRKANKADDVKERDEVFEILKENVSKIDPQKFTPRIFSEAIFEKRKIEGANEMIQNNPLGEDIFGGAEDWKEEVSKMLIKGLNSKQLAEERIEKALSHFDLI